MIELRSLIESHLRRPRACWDWDIQVKGLEDGKDFWPLSWLKGKRQGSALFCKSRKHSRETWNGWMRDKRKHMGHQTREKVIRDWFLNLEGLMTAVQGWRGNEQLNVGWKGWKRGRWPDINRNGNFFMTHVPYKMCILLPNFFANASQRPERPKERETFWLTHAMKIVEEWKSLRQRDRVMFSNFPPRDTFLPCQTQRPH